MPTLKGTGEEQLVREDVSNVFGQGWFTNREYYGPHDRIYGLLPALADDGWECETQPDGAYSRMTARRQAQLDNATTDYYDRFTITTETIEKDIWTLDAIHAEAALRGPLLTGDPDEDPFTIIKAYVEDAIDEGDENKLEMFYYGGGTVPNTVTWPALWGVYKELARGVQSYEEEYLVLTRERVVSYLYGQQLAIPQLNASNIYSTDSLKSTFLIQDMTGIAWPDDPTTSVPHAQWGWRHRRREVQFQEGQKIQIIQDWAWAAWSTNLYNYIP